MINKIVSILVLVSTINSFSADFVLNNQSHPKVAIKAGLGPISDNEIAMHFGMNVIKGKHCVSFRYLHAEELLNLDSSPAEHENEFGLLYGRSYSTRIFRLGAYSGLSLFEGNRRGSTLLYHDPGIMGSAHYNQETYTTVGIPIELNVSLIYFQYAGVEIAFLADINPENTVVGASVCLIFGRLR